MDALVKRAEAILARVLDGVALTMMAALVGVIAWSVFARQVLRISVAWSEEVGAGLLLWMVCLGAAAAWRRRGHIAIDVLLRRMGLKTRYWTLLVIEVGSLLLLTLIFIGAFSMMFVSANNATTALRISYFYLYLALVIGVGSMILFSAARFVRFVAYGPAMAAAAGEPGGEGGEWNTLSSS